MRKKTEADIDILRNEQGGHLGARGFEAKFSKFIIEHYLRKFHSFYLYLTHLITFFT